MPLTSGTRLGPYEIVAPLGAGGMGEVYRAKDTRLGRDIAVKVLARHLSANPEVRTRFEREARTVSALNHPHICTLHDVGREGDTDYLVLELIEGETLAHRLARGPLPTPEVLRLGAQIADALDRAHRAGVVHRDLKPGNVMLTRSGAKLMDFGLARATGLAGPAGGSGVTVAAMTQSPTVAQPLTAEGTIVGTFQYMAPEQLEGKEADARSDLWALGCVLYEMATGRRAFEGRSQASLISAIMSGQPAPVSLLAPMSPPALDRLVGRCLAKEPDDRWQSARDLMHELRALAEPSTHAAAPAAGMRAAARPRAPWLTWAALLVGVAGITLAATTWLSGRSERPAPAVVQIPMPPDLELHPFWSSHAVSPDGEHVVASARHGDAATRLWLWNLRSADPVVLAGTEAPWTPCWSPDGRQVAYFSRARLALMRVSINGGNPTRICEMPDDRGMTWGRRNVIVFAPTASGPLHQVPASGGTPTPATELDAARGEAGHRFPCFLPDGEHFLFVSLPRGPRGFQVHVGSLGSKRRRPLMEADGAPVYVEPGYLVFRKHDKMMAQRFDAGRMRLTGEPFALADAPPFSDFDGEPVATASRDGRLLFASVVRPQTRFEWIDRSGNPQAAVAVPAADWVLLALSPDQRLAAATRDGDLWQIDLDRALATRLARSMVPEQTVAWSPDGRRLALSRTQGRAALDIVHVGTGIVDSVPSAPALFQDVMDWSPDGRSLIVAMLGQRGGTGAPASWDLWTVPLGGGRPAPYVATPALERFARISPDGRWMLCGVFADDQLDVFIDSYPVPGRRTHVFSGQRNPRAILTWGRDGREVIYSEPDGDMMSAPVEFAGGEARIGRPARLFAIPRELGHVRTRDGERFLVTRPVGRDPGPALRLILNWTALANR